MPKEIKNLKEFLGVCARKDARYVKVKKNTNNTKFKIRCSKYLYTLVLNDKKKAEKLQKSIHPTVKQILVTKRAFQKKRATTK